MNALRLVIRMDDPKRLGLTEVTSCQDKKRGSFLLRWWSPGITLGKSVPIFDEAHHSLQWLPSRVLTMGEFTGQGATDGYPPDN